MKMNNSGFSAGVLLVGVIMLTVIGFGAFYLVQNHETATQNNASLDLQSTDTTSSDSSDESDNVVEVNLHLKSVEDLDNLPAITPESFKELLKEDLAKNTPDENGCVSVYNISKVSKANIEGGAYAESDIEEANIEDCGSGAPILWVLTADGDWDQLSGNGYPDCESINGGLVYEEFATECYATDDSNDLIQNPNGSVSSLEA